MSEQIELKIDKSQWPDGPWRTEPDRLQWVHAGYACLMVRHPALGHWCGYVGVDRTHPDYGKSSEDPDVQVHGGLTYAAPCRDNICHVPAPGMPDDVWWFGFDCAHWQDLSPNILGLNAKTSRIKLSSALREIQERHLEVDVYRDVEYVKRECEGLADQLRNIAELDVLL